MHDGLLAAIVPLDDDPKPSHFGHSPRILWVAHPIHARASLKFSRLFASHPRLPIRFTYQKSRLAFIGGR